MERLMKLLPRYEIKIKNGYVALMSVIILGVAGGLITLTLYLTGVEGTQSSDLYIKSSEAKALADACLEIALGKIITSLSSLETGSLTLGNGSCNFSITNGIGSIKYISSTANVADIIRKVSVIVDPSQFTSNHTIKILSWQEIP